MKKILNLWVIVALISLTFGASAFADQTVKASVTESRTYFDGEQADLTGFNIQGSNYFRLRDIAEHFSGTSSQFNVSWNIKSQAVEVSTGQVYVPDGSGEDKYYSRSRTYPAIPQNLKLLIDGTLQTVKAYKIDGSNYVQLRDLAGRIPYDVEYEASAGKLSLFARMPEHAYRVKSSAAGTGNAETSYFPRWKSPVESYLVKNQDGTVTAIRADGQVEMETYDSSFQLVSRASLPYELPVFGGFYSGETYNYIAYGQDDTEENDDKEVIRIVRYDKSFKRIDSVSVKGGPSYTVKPFDAGSGRMAESGSTLVFHTSRERYTTPDGLNHQSQLTLIINTSNMTVTNDLGRFQSNHVSHSFDQYVRFDGADHVLVDHGDAYPRSIVLNKGDGRNYTEVDLFKIPGAIGANQTGVSLGGFEVSSSSYIVAMNTIDHSQVAEYNSYDLVGLKKDQRDIILSVLPKNNLNQSAVKQITLGKYVGSNRIASIPKLVKINDDKLMALWQEFDLEGYPGDLKYVYLDKDGNLVGSVRTLAYFGLSECDPVVSGNQVLWYTDRNGYRVFYSIPLEGETSL